jgi:hypothetical protein
MGDQAAIVWLEQVKSAVGLDNGASIDGLAKQFIQAIEEHRHWTRARKDQVPA